LDAGSGGVATVPGEPLRRDAAERAERARMHQERAQADAAHEAAKVQCYQQFMVNGCLLQARDQRNAHLADLKRQENALNDLQRKRRGAQQIQRTEDRTAPERQLAIAQQRGQALAAAALREQRQAEKREARAERGADTGAQAPAKVRSTPSGRQKEPSVRQPPGGKKKVQKQAKQPKAARSTAPFDQRQTEAREHRQKVQTRVQQAQKPPAASLAIPAN
jgi:colicin import membrane protein